ncbi:unnamed protein product [Rotaria magnacalcarata]|uniref:CUB domain-containing protein n=2 Tax=Rotaria magnacalcarata TaxID=392030 RepID=A0A816T0N9_9BILA|nr:unnamed protein product [Rotaria magnacalcarata]CAF2086861.1 unnamed protein product [Rotaria magnacalcarata]CAF4114099.1 unnamed protein product [Rotaria magnacalcarata]
MILHLFLLLFQLQIKQISTETISGCTINNNNRRITNGKTSVTLSCPNNGYILVKNLTFGVHKTSLLSITPTCSYQPGDCTTRTTYIGMECNGLTTCDLDLNPQYLHICSQYSDYMVLDYSCLQGQSLSVCDSRLISTSFSKENRLFLRSPNYPHEYENSLNCSCQISAVKSQMKFLDFYLEERDEINICSRDHLQIHNRSYCGSSIDDNNYRSSSFSLNSSFQLTFKTNDVITRKGFWLSINSEQPIQVSCNSLIEPTSPITTTTTITTPTSTTLQYSIPSSLIPLTESSRFNHNESNSNNNNNNRRHALSYILILTIVFVIILLLLNIVLIILCWRQRRPKGTMNSKINSTNQPFVCSVRSSTSSSIIYGETPVLTSLDIQKQPTLSSRYIFQPNQQHSDTTPSTSTTTATGPYDDLNESMTLQRSFHKERSFDNQFLYLQNRPTFSSPNTAYNRMIHFPPVPIRCNFSTPVQTFYPPQPLFDSQHIYETIHEGQCPYQRLAATLRRQQTAPCSCYYEHDEQLHPTRTHINENLTILPNPETLV